MALVVKVSLRKSNGVVKGAMCQYWSRIKYLTVLFLETEFGRIKMLMLFIWDQYCLLELIPFDFGTPVIFTNGLFRKLKVRF